MPALQLELNFQQQLHQAQSSPVAVDWQQLCLAFDVAIARTPLNQQLALAGDAIVELAEVFALRAEAWFEDLRPSPDGPVLAEDALADLVRQSMSLDLDELLAEPEPVTRRSLPKEAVESRVEIVEKDVLLQALEGELREPEQALQVVEAEDVAAWVDAIATVLEQEGGQVGLGKLLKRLNLSEGMVFLGLLLGEFELQQEGRFYDRRITVTAISL
jgi:chromatin segregation and condensation protein Rec8/ScpA/Scc1 (kleisin family)